MEYKLKTKIDVESLTFKKKVLEETIDLLGTIKNYTKTGLEFNLMLGFLDNVLEGNTLLEELAKSTRLLDEIEETVEPLYKSIVLENEVFLQAFNSMFEELAEYADREMNNNRNITGLLYNIIEELGSLKTEEVVGMVTQLVDLAANKFVPFKPVTKETKKEQSQEVKKEGPAIEDAKMLELIEKFKGQGNITK